MIGKTKPVVQFISLKGVEEVCYPIACQYFSDPDYKMPALQWHDKKLMEGALASVQNSYYQTVPELGAALVYYISKDHPLKDGNKRLSVIVLLSFLEVNGYHQIPNLKKDEVVRFMEWLTASPREQMGEVIQEAAVWIKRHFKTGLLSSTRAVRR